MNTEHTPGPWIITGTVGGDGVAYVQSADRDANDNWEVAKLLGPDGAANARLIAAAPDLLEACKNLENDNGIIPDHAWNMIQAAIAKAEGRDGA